MTNGDKIRAMTDEELAEMRAEILTDIIEKIAEKTGLEFNYSVEQFNESYLDWLKKEATA